VGAGDGEGDDEDVVVLALRRFGYSTEGWGLKERQWSAKNAARHR